MGRYSCAIGLCPEKTYNKSQGVKFFHLNSAKGNVQLAWKRKILSTRRDITKLSDIRDHVICSRHFPLGDRSKLPSIIPRLVGKKIAWPGEKCYRHARELSVNQQDGDSSFVDTDICTDDENTTTDIGYTTPTRKSLLDKKLSAIQDKLQESPPGILKEILRNRQEELNALPSQIRDIHDSLTTPGPAKKSPPLSVKVKNIKEKNDLISLKDVSRPAGRPDVTVVQHMSSQLQEKDKKIKELEHMLAQAKINKTFGIERFRGSPCDMVFYTGIPDYLTFLSILEFLGPERHQLVSLDYTPKETYDTYMYVNCRGRKQKLNYHDQLFLVLSKLRQGYLSHDLADRFNISEATVNNVFTMWIKHMAQTLKHLPIWPKREFVQNHLPEAFKQLGYDKTRCIIDCTELFIQRPSNLVLQSVTFSTYKNHNTSKALVGILPHGPICFVSNLYAGSASDYEITKQCGLIDLLDEDDHIMADKGFEIQDLLDEKRIRVDHPPVLRNVNQMTVAQEQETRRIARLRIHVERAIERIKNFRILSHTVPFHLFRMLNDIWQVCAYLTHFQPPLIDDSE